jgi:hypothetical protein
MAATNSWGDDCDEVEVVEQRDPVFASPTELLIRDFLNNPDNRKALAHALLACQDETSEKNTEINRLQLSRLLTHYKPRKDDGYTTVQNRRPRPNQQQQRPQHNRPVRTGYRKPASQQPMPREGRKFMCKKTDCEEKASEEHFATHWHDSDQLPEGVKPDCKYCAKGDGSCTNPDNAAYEHY